MSYGIFLELCSIRYNFILEYFIHFIFLKEIYSRLFFVFIFSIRELLFYLLFLRFVFFGYFRYVELYNI